MDQNLEILASFNSYPPHLPTADYSHMDGGSMMVMMEKGGKVDGGGIPFPEAESASGQPSGTKIGEGSGSLVSGKNIVKILCHCLG